MNVYSWDDLIVYPLPTCRNPVLFPNLNLMIGTSDIFLSIYILLTLLLNMTMFVG